MTIKAPRMRRAVAGQDQVAAAGLDDIVTDAAGNIAGQGNVIGAGIQRRIVHADGQVGVEALVIQARAEGQRRLIDIDDAGGARGIGVRQDQRGRIFYGQRTRKRVVAAERQERAAVFDDVAGARDIARIGAARREFKVRTRAQVGVADIVDGRDQCAVRRRPVRRRCPGQGDRVAAVLEELFKADDVAGRRAVDAVGIEVSIRDIDPVEFIVRISAVDLDVAGDGAVAGDGDE